jgi:hypothetical protein
MSRERSGVAQTVATGYGPGSIPGKGKIFVFSTTTRLDLGLVQPPIQWVPGTITPGLRRPRREADHSPPTSGEVKKTLIYKSTPPYAFMA